MNFKNPYWSEKEKIDLLQRWIIIHSIIYYELGENIVTDKAFDMNCRQLMQYKKNNKSDYKKSRYFDVFKDFDGCTGFDLFRRLEGQQQHRLMEEAQGLINQFLRKEK